MNIQYLDILAKNITLIRITDIHVFDVCLILYPILGAFIFAARFFVDQVYMFIFMVAMAMLFQGCTNPVENTFYYDLALVSYVRVRTHIVVFAPLRYNQ